MADPVGFALAYPGRRIEESGLVVGEEFRPLRALPHRDAGDWRLDGGPTTGGRILDDALAELGAAPMGERIPVLAVGANAAPDRLAAKLERAGAAAGAAIVPMVHARVVGLAVGCSAHVSGPGYVPAVPLACAAAVSRLVVTWLSRRQLEIVDATEPNYRRVRLDAARVAVTLASGTRVAGCEAYAGIRGHLLDGARPPAPRPLRDQPSLLSGLLHESPALRRLCGTTPREFVTCVRRDAELRRQAAEVFVAERWVARHPGGGLLRAGAYQG